MNTCPIEPSLGDKISASWMRELIRYVRAITPMPGKNVRLRRTPNGTFIDGTPAGTGGAGDRNMLFAFGTTDVDGEKKRAIINCWYLRGGLLYHDDDFPLPELDDEHKWKSGFICYRIAVTEDAAEAGLKEDEEYDKERDADDYKPPSTGVAFYKSAAELRERQVAPDFYTYPLYKLNENGSVELDLRPLINIQVFEAL